MKKALLTLLKVLAWTSLVAVWIIIGGVLWMVLSPFVMRTSFVYLVVTIVLFAVAIIFRKKIKGGVLAALIYATILSVVVNCVACVGMIEYLSDYSKSKWGKYIEYRHFMIDDLRNGNELVGLSENEIKNLLGEPTKIVNRTEGYYVYEYYAGHRDWIDSYILEIVFKDGVSVGVTEGEH